MSFTVYVTNIIFSLHETSQRLEESDGRGCQVFYWLISFLSTNRRCDQTPILYLTLPFVKIPCATAIVAKVTYGRNRLIDTKI